MSTESDSEQVSPTDLSTGGGDSGSESSAFSDPEVAAMTAAQLHAAAAANRLTGPQMKRAMEERGVGATTNKELQALVLTHLLTVPPASTRTNTAASIEAALRDTLQGSAADEAATAAAAVMLLENTSDRVAFVRTLLSAHSEAVPAAVVDAALERAFGTDGSSAYSAIDSGDVVPPVPASTGARSAAQLEYAARTNDLVSTIPSRWLEIALSPDSEAAVRSMDALARILGWHGWVKGDALGLGHEILAAWASGDYGSLTA